MIRTAQTRSLFAPYTLALSLAAGLIAVAPAAHADTIRSGGAVTVTPGGRTIASGLRTAVVAVTDTTGNADAAQSAMLAANVALDRVPGFIAVPAKEVAGAFGKIPMRDTPDAKDYMAIGKALKAQRVLTVTITPGDASDASALYSAVAELYDTKTGALVNRGEGTFTATADAVAADTDDKSPAAATGKMEDALPNRSLSGAVYQAINELNKPATFNGIVLSIPGGYQARLSVGEFQGVRNGARVEYLRNGQAFAYGTVFDVGASEALASVAPESAASLVTVNTPVRTVSNPSVDRAGKTSIQQAESEFKRFERDFGISAAIAGVIYYAAIRD